jgi:hypothetical protein
MLKFFEELGFSKEISTLLSRAEMSNVQEFDSDGTLH